MAVLVKELLKNYHKIDIDTRLDLDMAIKDLTCRGKLSSGDSDIVDLIKLQYSIPEIASKLERPERTVYRKHTKICYRIAQRLGISYQDIKIVLQVREKLGRELTDEEFLFCQYMISHLGYNQDTRISIFNFEMVGGRIKYGNGKRKTERQVGLQVLRI